MKKLLFLCIGLLALARRTLEECCAAGCLDASKSLALGDSLEAIPIDTTSTFNTSEVCGSVFKAKGTCCQNTKLKSYANKMVLRIKTNLLNIETAIQFAPTVIRKLSYLLQVFRTKASFPAPVAPAVQTGPTDDSVFRSTIGGLQKYHKIKPLLEFLEYEKDDLLDMISKKDYETTKCYETLLNKKLNAICLACSGDSSSFYNPTSKKFKIKSNYCTDLVNSCSKMFNVFYRVHTTVHIARFLKKALSSTDLDVTFDDEFSLARLINIDDCAKDRISCNKTATMLTNFCREIGLVSDINLIKLAQGRNSDASTLSQEAATTFATAQSEEDFKLDGYLTTLTATQSDLQPTGIPAKVLDITSYFTQIATAQNDYNTQENTINLAGTLEPARETARTARRAKMDSILNLQTQVFGTAIDISRKMVDLLTSYLKDNNNSVYAANRDLLVKVSEVLNFALEGQRMIVELRPFKTVYDNYETTVLLGKILRTGVQPDYIIDSNYYTRVENLRSVFAQFKTNFEAITTQVNTFCATRFTEVAAEVTQVGNLKSEVVLRNKRLPYAVSLELEALRKYYEAKNKTLAETYRDALVNQSSYLSTTTAVSLVTTITADYLHLKNSLSALSTAVAALSSEASAGASTFRSAVTAQKAAVTSLGTNLDTISTNLTALQTTGDLNIKAMQTNANLFILGLGATDSQMIKDNGLVTQNKNYLRSNLTANQDKLALVEANDKQLLTNAAQLFDVLTQMLDIDTKKGETQAVRKIEIAKAIATLSYYSGKASVPCASPTAAETTFCSLLTSSLSTLPGVQSTAQTALTSETSAFESQWTTLKTSLDSRWTTIFSVVASLNQNLGTTDGFAKTMTSLFTSLNETRRVAIESAKWSAELTSIKLKLVKATLKEYETITQKVTTDGLSEEIITVNECKTAVTGVFNALVAIEADTASASSAFVSILTSQKSKLDALVVKLGNLYTAKAAMTSAVTAARAARGTTTTGSLKTEYDALVKNVTDITANLTAITNNITGLEYSFTNPARRVLQTPATTEDFEFDEAAGADVVSLFASGVIVNPSLTETSAGFTNGPGEPVNATNTTAEETAGLVWVSVLCLASMTAILI